MDFSTDIFDLIKEDKSFSLVGATIPSSKDVFFRAKQDEISQQYQSARIFMYETEIDDWEHWGKVSNAEFQEAFQLMFKGIMFETALMFYNIVVDLSWVLCYVTIELLIIKKAVV